MKPPSSRLNDRLHPSEPDALALLLGGPAAHVERAAAELRAGRPVVIEAEKERLAVLALDAAAPAMFEAFLSASADAARLFLAAPRAALLGLAAPRGALLPLAGLDLAGATRLAASREHGWSGGFDAPTPAAAFGAKLARLAQLLPALAVTETAGRPAFASCLVVGAPEIDAAFASAPAEFREIARTRVPLREVGEAEFVVFRGGLAQRDQVAIVVGAPDFAGPVPVRIHSSCITGDLFGSLKCDCGDQLRLGLEQLLAHGGGVLLYLDQEGRGTGLAAKLTAYGFQAEGLDTVDADAELGFEGDERRYEAAVALLRELGISTVRLLTNNPAKAAFLEASGVAVAERIPLLGRTTAQNLRYLDTKARRAGHLLKVDAEAGAVLAVT